MGRVQILGAFFHKLIWPPCLVNFANFLGLNIYEIIALTPFSPYKKNLFAVG
jgi:hypothetical protein